MNKKKREFQHVPGKRKKIILNNEMYLMRMRKKCNAKLTVKMSKFMSEMLKTSDFRIKPSKFDIKNILKELIIILLV
jgi:hypothetical protein